MKHRGILAGAIVFGLALALFAPAIARAQEETGGSMGGGDFSTSSSSSSYSSSSSSDYSSPSSDYSYSGGGGGGGGGSSGGSNSVGIVVVVMVGMVWMIAAAFKATSSTYKSFSALPSINAPSAYGTDADITVLRVGIDARARKLVQSELARIAGVADTKTAAGRATMLREVALMLRRLRDSWVYGGAHNEPMMSMSAAQQVFQRHVDDARGRFKTEMFTNTQGAISRADAPALHSTTDDGPGVVLVSVIVAARHELFTVNQIADGEELRKAFESLSTMIAGELVAVQIVWMPAAEDERISSIALETAYPRPQLMPIAGALVGKVFCEFCGSPYPAEAIACPNCGGRAKGAAA